jgi:cysteine desulfurase / selenocysteine lyase
VLVTEMEHHADLLPWRHRGGHLMVGLTPDGHIDLDAIEHALRDAGGKVGLVAVSGASNVTGFISPIHEIAELAHRHGALVSVDAAQLAPHRRIDIRPADDPGHLDFVSFSGHKMYAPYGAGVLVAPRDFFAGAPEVMGGGAIRIVTWDDTVWADLPDREEAGSPNVIGAVALGIAIETLVELGFDQMLRHEAELGARLVKSLSEIPGVEVLGGIESTREAQRLGLASFVIDGVHHGLAAAALSHEWGVAVRNGCFCANPYVFHLLNMNKEAVEKVEGEVAADRRKALPGAVRASLAPYNNKAEIDRFADAVMHIARGQMKASYEQASDGTFAPAGGWPAIPNPLKALVQPAS